MTPINSDKEMLLLSVVGPIRRASVKVWSGCKSGRSVGMRKRKALRSIFYFSPLQDAHNCPLAPFPHPYICLRTGFTAREELVE